MRNVGRRANGRQRRTKLVGGQGGQARTTQVAVAWTRISIDVERNPKILFAVDFVRRDKRDWTKEKPAPSEKKARS
jgi:ribosomal protein S9